MLCKFTIVVIALDKLLCLASPLQRGRVNPARTNCGPSSYASKRKVIGRRAYRGERTCQYAYSKHIQFSAVIIEIVS